MVSHSSATLARAVILTALGLEHSAVTRHLAEPLSEQTERGLIFNVGFFAGQRSWLVGVAEVGPGNSGASIMAERAVTAFRPDVVMFVGIAGGRKDVRHGDVVAAEAVYDYETGKAENDDYLPRVKTFAPSFDLVQRARAVARGSRWQETIRTEAPMVRPSAFVKPIAAGSKVVAGGRSATAQFLNRHCGDALAVDMESHGFLHGAYVNGAVATLVVRGISDLLDDKTADNDRDWQIPAACNAAAFTFAVLGAYVPEAAADGNTPSVGDGQHIQINHSAPDGAVYANQGSGNQTIHNYVRGEPR